MGKFFILLIELNEKLAALTFPDFNSVNKDKNQTSSVLCKTMIG